MALTYVKASGIDTTGNYTMGNLTITANLTVANANITGPTTFSNISLAGNIIPTVANAYSLGNASFYFKDAFIGPGSLYIDGQKVMQSVANTIVVSADINQTLKMATSGSGDIQLDPTGTGVIAIKGPLQIEAGSNITSSDGSAIRFTNPVSTDTLSGLSANTDITLSALGTGHVKVDDDLIITGNLSVQGTSGNFSVTTLTVKDNIIDISAETTGTPTANAGLRVIRGDQAATQLRWYESGTVWQITNDGTNYLTIVGKDTNGNISVGNITGTLITGSQPNITSTGTLTSLSITGNVTSGNANLGNVATANYFTGNGSLLTGITATTATTAATVTTNAQPNITSTGTLSTLTVTSTITATSGGVKVGNIQDPSGTNTVQLSSGSITVTGNITAGGGGSGNVTATYFIGNGSQLTGLPASYSNTNVAAYLPTYTGNFTAGNVTGATLVSATNLTGTLTTGAQPNITSTGTLTSVTVTANVTAGNIKSDNLLYANGTAWSLGSRYTANTTPPATGNVAGDQWLNTSANVLYEYINDGTGNYWIDVQTPTISSSSVTSTDSLSPFLLMGA